MGQINVSLPEDGETIDASDYNTPITTIVNEINGELDNSNIASDAAIAGTKLASSALFDREVNDTAGNEVLQFASTASAVNELTITNAATGNAPSIAATGGDTNISLRVNAKGTGTVQLGRPVAFKAYRSAAKNVTTSFTDIAHDTENYDYGSNFNAATGVFTAPYAGIYHLSASITLGANATRMGVQFVCSTAGSFLVNDPVPTDINRSNGTITLELAASETVKVQGISSTTIAVEGTDTWFSGFLVGRTD